MPRIRSIISKVASHNDSTLVHASLGIVAVVKLTPLHQHYSGIPFGEASLFFVFDDRGLTFLEVLFPSLFSLQLIPKGPYFIQPIFSPLQFFR
jgi:hypothetical protein